MKFRNYLFLVFSAVILIVLIFQWFLMNTLSRDLTQIVDNTVVEVGENLAKVLVINKSVKNPSIISKGDKDITIKRKNGRKVIILSEEVEIDRRLSHLNQSDIEIKVEPAKDKSTITIIADGQKKTIAIPKEGLDRTLKQSFSTVFLGLMGLFIFGLALIWLVARYFAKPLEQLNELAKTLGSGQLGVQGQVSQAMATEIKQTFAEFNKMSSKLLELNQQNHRLSQHSHLSELGDIGRGLAHSLRNPLHTIGLLAEKMSAQPKYLDRQKNSQEIFNQVSRIDRLICSFIALHQQDGLTCKDVNVTHVIQDLILELSANSIDGGDIKIEGPEATIVGLEAEIRIILQTLIANSIEAGAKAIVIRIIPDQQNLTLAIEDDGEGIPPKLLGQLFQPHITTKTDGAGMGLFLTSRIIEYRYQGEITFKTRSPQGALAIVRLKDRTVNHDKKL